MNTPPAEATPQARERRGTDGTPRRHCLDTRRIAEHLDESRLSRAIQHALKSASRRWNIQL
jgi:hypothetical protein